MPNWCENQLTVVGPDEELKRLRVVARRDGDEGIKEFSLEELLPTPPELLKGDKWYDWRLKHWGVKWDLGCVHIVSEEEGKLILTFDTAWGPPQNAFDLISEVFPELVFDLQFIEGGMNFCGRSNHSKGHRIIDNHINGYQSHEDIPDSIPFAKLLQADWDLINEEEVDNG